MTKVVEARQLCKAFRGKRAVDGVDLVVRAGERVALLGGNGAGKTTTLLMLLGAVSPDSGTVSLLGHPLPAERSECLRDVGFAAGYLPMPYRLRVNEILRIFGDIYGLTDPAAAAEEGLERFGISHLATQMAKELSSGQRTLVGIVKAILHRPPLLVLDEPTASLDPDVAARARRGLEQLCAEDGSALLVTSHNMTDVERMCERVVFLSKGRIVADGSPPEVAAKFGLSDLEQVFLHLAAEDWD